jgi:hypothetical protein
MKAKQFGMWTRAWVVFLCAVLVQPWGIWAADITPGYSFTSGEANVTHTKLNNSASGTINTSFYSGKGSAGSDPNTAFELLLRDTSLDVFKRTTLAAAFFDHTALLNSRTALTVPALDDLLPISDTSAGSAYKKITLTNFLFGSTETDAPSNSTRFPVLHGGALASLTLSNLLGGLTDHASPTNDDRLPVITGNHRAIKTVTLANLVGSAIRATNASAADEFVVHDGTFVRSLALSNTVAGLQGTNSTLATNDALGVLSHNTAQYRQLLLADLRQWISSNNVVQSTYTVTTNLAGSSGNWSNVTTIGTSTLSNAITPRATSSKILVRLVLSACANGNSQPGAVRVLRNGSAIGVGDDDGGNRTEAGAVIPQGADPLSVVWEWLDSPATNGAVLYNVQVKATSSTTVYINRTSASTDSENNSRTVSSLTLTEVFQ